MMKPAIIKNIFLLFLLFFLNLISGDAQEPIWKWASTGSYATIHQTKTDSVGNTYIFGKTSEQTITFGNYTITYDNANSFDNVFLVKYNSAGKILWAKGIYGIGDESPYIDVIKMTITENGEAAILFNYQYINELILNDNYSISVVNDSSLRYLAVKYSKTGIVQWAQTVEIDGISIEGTDLFIDNEGSTIVTGYSIADMVHFGAHTIEGQGNAPLFFLVKYNSVGADVWAYTCQLDPDDDNAVFNGALVTADSENNVYFAGDYIGTRTFYFGTDSLIEAGNYDIVLAKFSPTGTLQWVRSYGKDNNEKMDRINTDSEGNVYLCGYFQNGILNFDGHSVTNTGTYYDLFITKLNSNGIVQWATSVATQKTFLSTAGLNSFFNIDKNNFLYSAANFTSASIFSGANTIINPDPGTNDIFIAKFDSENGEVLWNSSGTGNGNNNMGSIVFDKYGNTYLAGTLNPTTIFNGNEMIDPTGTNGGFYIIRYNAEGVINFARSRVNPDLANRLYSSYISVDAFQNIYMIGSTQGEDNILGDINMNEVSPGSGIFLAKYSYVADINGLIRDYEGNFITSGSVKLIGYTMFQRSPLSDSVQIQSDGSYQFKDIPFGKYIIYANPAISYSKLVPTYYSSAGYWGDARQLLINSPVTRNSVNIFMREREERFGDAVLAGSVNELEEDELKTTKLKEAKPIAGSEVVLIRSTPKSGYEVIAITITDEYGNFSFENVEDGDYIILVDIPGIPHETYYNITIEGGEYYSNLDYFVDEESINISGEYTVIKSRNYKFPEIFTYPNPCKEELYIVLTNFTISPVHIEIYDIKGKIVFSKSILNPSAVNKLNINKLNSGLYILKTSYANNSVTGKLIIE